MISIHALREEGDQLTLILLQALVISIHALREEGDRIKQFCVTLPLYFYPRPPRGGRHACDRAITIRMIISIHALREEGDIY